MGSPGLFLAGCGIAGCCARAASGHAAAAPPRSVMNARRFIRSPRRRGRAGHVEAERLGGSRVAHRSSVAHGREGIVDVTFVLAFLRQLRAGAIRALRARLSRA